MEKNLGKRLDTLLDKLEKVKFGSWTESWTESDCSFLTEIKGFKITLEKKADVEDVGTSKFHWRTINFYYEVLIIYDRSSTDPLIEFTPYLDKKATHTQVEIGNTASCNPYFPKKRDFRVRISDLYKSLKNNFERDKYQKIHEQKLKRDKRAKRELSRIVRED